MIRYSFKMMGLLGGILLGMGYFSWTNALRTKSVSTLKGLPPLPEPLQDVEKRREKTSSTRFKTIKVPLEVALDETEFWTRQLSEHALIMHLALEEKSLKEEALVLHKKFEDFRKRMNAKNLSEILSLSQQLRDYKVRVLTRLLNGEWLGWMFPVFARHVITELDYFVDKLNGIPYSALEEAVFWDVINGEHAGLASHLLDPTQRKEVAETNDFSLLFEKIANEERQMLIEISLKGAQELDKYYKNSEGKIKSGAVKSVIHPSLIDHDIREGERAIQTLSRLLSREPRGPVPDLVISEEEWKELSDYLDYLKTNQKIIKQSYKKREQERF